MTIRIDNTDAGSLTIAEDTTPPGAPPVGEVILYAKTDGFLYSKDDAGVETQLGGGGGTPAGADTQIQFNNSGSFGADADFTYDNATGALYVNTTNGTSGSVSVTTPGNIAIFAAASSSAGGGTVTIQSGNSTSTSAGGAMNLTGGTGGATGIGGSVTIRGGAGGSTSGNGGAVNIFGGIATDGNGGTISISGRQATGTNRNGGNVAISSGAPTGSGTAGSITLDGGSGAALGSTSPGGNITLTGGPGGTSQSGGTTALVGGQANGAATGGATNVTGGTGGATGAGGAVTITGGAGGATSGNGGNLTLQGGNVTSGDVGDVALGRGTTTTTRAGDMMYIPTSAGTPTGTPNGSTGRVAMLFDTTNDKAYVYDTSWRYVGGAAVNTMWFAASGMTPRTTNGAAPGITESTTNQVMYDTLDFDQTTSEYAQFNVSFPKGWDLGTVTAEFYWTATTGSGTVTWGLQGLALSDDDAIDTAFGTAQTVTDTLLATGDLHRSSATAAITIAGTPAEGDWVVFQVYRDVADTLTGDARLIGVKLFYTATTLDDA